MKKLVLTVLLVLALVIPAMAQENAVSSLNVVDLLNKIPNLQQGIAYSIADSRFNYLTTIECAKFKGFSFGVGYAGVAKNTGDKVVATATYNILNIKSATFPILDIIRFEPGIYVGYGSINIEAVNKSEFDYGVAVKIIDIKF